LAAWAIRRRNWRGLTGLALGCALLVLPWCLRNVLVAGRALPLAGASTIWLRDYPEIFSYGLDLSPARYFAWGLRSILGSKLLAIGRTVEPALGAWPVLGPLAAIGIWVRRDDVRVRLAGWYWLALWLVMVLVFTFPAQRGSLYHSMAALVPWQAALAPEGIARINEWVARRWSGWDSQRYTRYFIVCLTLLACIFALAVFAKGAVAAGVWLKDRRLGNDWQAGYRLADRWLSELDLSKDDPVIVTDPPVFAGVTGRRAIVLPLMANAAVDYAALDSAADRYGASCLVLADEPEQVLSDQLREHAWQQVRGARVGPAQSLVGLYCRRPEEKG
jgi:hypothetical protein